MSNSSFTQEPRDNGLLQVANSYCRLSCKGQQPLLTRADINRQPMIDELNTIILAQQNSPDGLLLHPLTVQTYAQNLRTHSMWP
jgi:hypothetical protein